MNILENILPPSYAGELERQLMGPNFPWNYNSSTVDKSTHTDALTTESQQFTHVLAYHGEPTSPYYSLVQPILYFLEASTGLTYRVERIKANMLLKDATYPQGHYHSQHRDVPLPSNCSSLIYYVNDADGDTLFFNEQHELVERITPKRNTLVLFDSTQWHASTQPRVSNNRVVINFIMEPQ